MNHSPKDTLEPEASLELCSPKQSRVRSTIIPDHEGNDVTLAWYTSLDRKYPVDQPPPFPFQVYFTKGAEKSAADPSFAASLVCLVEEQGHWTSSGANLHARFEFYSKPFPNILACIAHQRREIHHRNRNAVHPRLLAPSRAGLQSYDGHILVIDRDDCLSIGAVVVEFEPAVYRRGRQSEEWYHARDVPVVASVRQPFGSARQPFDRSPGDYSLVARLKIWWGECGNTWTEADLARRNEGAVSPALYPAVDPDSHYDVEHEAVHELDGTALPDPSHTTDLADIDSDEVFPIVEECLRRDELFLPDADLSRLATETYSDLLGQPVTSVWDRRLSKTRPSFSFMLYLGYDVLPVRPRALFTCLNKGLLAESQWTLDIMTKMPSLESTLDYNARSAKQRTSSRLGRLRRYTETVLEKINNRRLPAEILEQIENILVPPGIPNYSSRPMRPHQDLFLYLDGSHLSTGPLVVYSNQACFEHNTSLLRPRYDIDGIHAFEDIPLRVLFFRFWHRVADEMHTIWSLCGPRLPIPASSLPSLTLRLSIPSTCVPERPHRYNPDLPGPNQFIKFELHSAFDDPITVHTTPLLSHDLFDEALDIVDLSTGETLPPLPSTHYSLEHGESWLQSRALGYLPLQTPQERRSQHMQTLHPHTWTEMQPPTNFAVWRFKHWLRQWAETGPLVARRQYALRLREDVRVLRWTYGSVEERKGPYNLPSLPLRMEDEDGVKFWVELAEGNLGEE